MFLRADAGLILRCRLFCVSLYVLIIRKIRHNYIDARRTVSGTAQLQHATARSKSRAAFKENWTVLAKVLLCGRVLCLLTSFALQMGSYPLIFLLTFGIGSVDRLYNFATNKESLALSLVHVVLSASQGWMDAIAYGLTNKVMR